MASTEGGVEIEKVAEETPEKILKAEIDPLVGAQAFQGRDLAFRLGLSGVQIKQFVAIFLGLAKLFADKDLALIEVNPLVITDEGNLHCLDAKVVVDSNALYRQPELEAMHDPSQEDEREAHAAQWELNYVALDGSIGCMVNGAGLAMGTMDIVKLHGGSPANFLDVGGGATKERVTEAFKIILSDDNVKAVLINIFGGIVRAILPKCYWRGGRGRRQRAGGGAPRGQQRSLGREVLAGSGSAVGGEPHGRRSSVSGSCGMSILINAETRVICQASPVRRHVPLNRRSPTAMVGGVTPGKGGQTHLVCRYCRLWGSCANSGQCVGHLCAAPFCKDSILEAAYAGIGVVSAH